MSAEVIVAKNCGFCFGVRRAVDMVYALRRSTDKKIYVIGELIHNATFIERLKNDGIVCIGEEDLPRLLAEKDGCILVIRTHGVTKDLSAYLADNGFETVDATCPFVSRIHTLVDENSRDADLTFIVGDEHHPEVVGIRSYARGQTVVFADDKECCDFVKKHPETTAKSVIMVSQTTGNNEKYVNCQKKIENHYTKSKIFDTICNVTESRQNEAASLASRADVVCVIGCVRSSNTKKLYEISREHCRNVYLIENASDVPKEDIRLLAAEHDRKENVSERPFTVVLTAGASTPDDIIEEVKVSIHETVC